jgi:exodeoxyribonuclease V alpha subunit
VTLSTGGTAKERFLTAHAPADDPGARRDPDDFEPAYLGWELARCAAGLTDDERRALSALAAACVLAIRAGSTRLPIDEAGHEGDLAAALAPLGAGDCVGTARSLLARARIGDAADPVTAVIGRPGERKPLLLDGAWLYPERMRTLEDRFCERVRDRIARAHSGPDPRPDPRSMGRALAAVTAGPPALTEEQKRAVREGLVAPLALITGGPGTGKTTIVVALLRALAWTGASMEAIAIAAPTGKAARRLHDAIAAGLASASGDIGEAGLRLGAPLPQTLHRLLGWSPASARFARHENDPLPHRVVVVDEASMVDLAMMDRLMRALSADARLVLLGDADQLPSVEAGAVFRDLCAGLRSVRLSTNLRVGTGAAAQRIVGAAQAVNGGKLDARFTASVETRRTVRAIAFEGVEHLAALWTEVGDELLDRYWRERVVAGGDFLRRAARVYRAPAGSFDETERAELDALFAHHARSRLLCVTRVRGIPTSADAINERLLARLERVVAAQERVWRSHGSLAWAPGAPAMVEHNDYEHDLHNGDQGVVVRVDRSEARGNGAPELMAVFRHRDSFRVLPVEGVTHLTPAFAMTVHKAQGSEFDDVVLVLPDADAPSWARLLTRELLYTAMTRARRSVLLVGPMDLLARATSRTVERHSGVAERLADSPV